MSKNWIDSRDIKSMAQRVGETFHANKVILFGSYAWGKPGPDSDVDLFVVMKSKKRPAERAADVYRLIYPHDFPVDVMVRTPQEIKRRRAMGDFFIEDIMTKGKVLYEQRPH